MIRYFLFLWLFIVYAPLLVAQNNRIFYLPEGVTRQDYEPNVVVVKIFEHSDNPNQRILPPSAHAENFKKLLQARSVNQLFPDHQPSSNTNARNSGNRVDLENIFKIYLNEGEDVVEAINLLLQQPSIVYAEPYYNIRPLHVPNDPDANKETGFQDHLNVIKAYDAWAITKGDTSVVIGVLDTGFNPDHEDLIVNIKNNHKDPINNFDDDDDGYKDNFGGWDFANNDSKPIADKNGHGTEVIGVSSASSNNGIGIAGTGYNSKYMPLKIYKSEDDSFAFGYEAIVYAADKGCKVMNLSWGDYKGGFSNFVQDIINYAALEKDVVIVAAAGNTPDQLNFYPASYNNVLSVGATDIDDNKTSWATYSYHIDLMAPGQSVYTTKNNGTYGHGSGSSFSSPMVAGAAALVRAKFPELNALQVMERLRITADDIYHIPYNQTFQDKLGKGRLNMHRAVSDYNSPAIRMKTFKFNNKFGAYAFPGDTVEITGQFINYLAPTTNATITLNSSSPYITVINGSFNIGSLGTLSTIENVNNSFRIILRSDTPPGTLIPIRMVYEDGTYNDFQIFEFETTPDYLTLNNGIVGLTISGNGNLGYHNDNYNQGIGFTYQKKRILEHMGVMISTDPSKVYNNVIHRFDNHKRNNDFSTITPIKFFNNGTAFLEARSHFEDNATEIPKQNLKIDQKLLSFKDLPDNDFFILEYRILNNSGVNLSNVYSGIYADWNINNKLLNIVQWNEEHKLGFIHDPLKPDLFAGIALLTPQQAGAYAINNASNISGDLSEDFIFSRTEKYKVLSNGLAFANSHTGSTGYDASHTISAKITTLNDNEHVKVAYALVGGTSIENLLKNVEAARNKYEEHIKNPPLIFSTYICEGQTAEIKPNEGNNFRFYTDLELTNLIYSGTSFKTAPIDEDTTFYVVNMDKGYPGDVMQAKVLINRSVSDFSINPETLILSEENDNTVQFNDFNENSVKWNWTFGNGYGSTIKDPKVKYFSSGTYTVKLVVENSSGCKNTVYKKIVVLQQSPDPVFTDLQICQGTIPLVKAENSSKIKVYASLNDPYPIFEGSAFEPTNLSTDTTFYISNASLDVDSPKKPLFIAVSPHKAFFDLQPYNDNLNNKNLFKAKNLSTNSISRKWYINNIYINDDVDLVIDVENYQELNIKLISWNPDACEEIMELSVLKRKSDTPIIGKVTSCNGRDAVIAPSNGTNFYFYEDKELTKLLYKGKSFSTITHQRIFITGVDNFIESDPVEVVIDYQTFYPDFIIQPEILNLSYNQQVIFTDLSEGNLTWNWDFGNGIHQHVKNPIQIYDEPGEYWITLVAENQNGCKESITKKLLVVNITDVDERADVTPQLTIYPNPAENLLFLNLTQHDNQILNIKIFDHLSRPVYQKEHQYNGKPLELDISQYASGLYHLQVETLQKLYYKKVIFGDK